MGTPVEPWMMEAPRPGVGGEAWHDLDERLLRWRREFEELVTSLTSTVTWSGQASDAFHQKAMNSESSFKTMRVQTGEIGDRMDTFFMAWRWLAPQIEDAKRALRVANENVDRLNEAAVQDTSLGDQVTEAQDAAVRKEEELVSLVGQLINRDSSESAGVNGATATLSACLDVDTRSAWVGQIVPPSALLALSLAKVHMPSDQDLMRIAAAGQLVGADTAELQERLAGIVAQHFPGEQFDGDVVFDEDIAKVIKTMSGEPHFVNSLLLQIGPFRLRQAAKISAKDTNSALFLGLHGVLATATEKGFIDNNFVHSFISISAVRNSSGRELLLEFVASAPKDSAFITRFGKEYIVSCRSARSLDGELCLDSEWDVVDCFIAAMSSRQIRATFAADLRKPGSLERSSNVDSMLLLDYYLSPRGDQFIDKPSLVKKLVLAAARDEDDDFQTQVDKAYLFGEMVSFYGKNDIPDYAKSDVFDLLLGRTGDLMESMALDGTEDEGEGAVGASSEYALVLSRTENDKGDFPVLVCINQEYMNEALKSILDTPERVEGFSLAMRDQLERRLDEGGGQAPECVARVSGYTQGIIQKAAVEDLNAKHQAINNILDPAKWVVSDLPIAGLPGTVVTESVGKVVSHSQDKEGEELAQENENLSRRSHQELRKILLDREIAKDPNNPLFERYLTYLDSYHRTLAIGDHVNAVDYRSKVMKEAQYVIEQVEFRDEHGKEYDLINKRWQDGHDYAYGKD